MTPELEELVRLIAIMTEANPDEQRAAKSRFYLKCREIAARTGANASDIETHANRAYHLMRASADRRSGRPPQAR